MIFKMGASKNKPAKQAKSLYEQLGGQEAVSRAVEIFYRKILRDERVSGFFTDDIDMERQMAKQAAFLTMVLGGPHQYQGRDVREAHRRLVKHGLNDKHVDIVIQHLGDTLLELGASASAIKQVAEIANSVRDEVLDR